MNALLAVPPEETTALPPLLTVSPLITPPEEATTVAPDTTAPLNSVTSAGSVPPGNTVRLVSAEVSAPSVRVPLLMTAPPSARLAPALTFTLDSVAPA